MNSQKPIETNIHNKCITDIHSWRPHPIENNINCPMETPLQLWPIPCICHKNVDNKHKEHICNWHECMTNARRPSSPRGEPCYDTTLIHPRPTFTQAKWSIGVNMWRRVTMIWLKSLSVVKEVEPMNQHFIYLPRMLQDPQELIHHSRCQTHELTYPFNELNPSLFYDKECMRLKPSSCSHDPCKGETIVFFSHFFKASLETTAQSFMRLSKTINYTKTNILTKNLIKDLT